MRELSVDWAALHSAFQMNMPEVKCFLNLQDGKVLKLPPGDPALGTVRSQPDTYVLVDAIQSRIQYQWVDDFVRTIEDSELRERVLAAINGKGAFRRFKDLLLALPDERRRWFEYRDQRMRDRIVEWVREQGIEATNTPTWSALSSSEQDGEAPKSALAPEPTPSLNNPHDVEALREFLIEWADGKGKEALQPLALDALTQEISKRFRVTAQQH